MASFKVGDTVVEAEAGFEGNCPRCGQPFIELVLVNERAWLVCPQDRVKVFQGWRHGIGGGLTEEDHQRSREELQGYEEGEPLFPEDSDG